MIEAMVAPPEFPRNAAGAQSEGRVGGGRPSTPVQRGQQCKHYKGRSPKAPARLVRRSDRDGGGMPRPNPKTNTGL
jgi:hypothetical protein